MVEELSPWVAVVGGLLSFLSPCVVPMVPVYLASLCGPEIFEGGTSKRRLTVFLHSLSFVIGLSIVFILLGTGAGLAGFAISAHMNLVTKISGVLMVLFGLFLLAAPRLSWLNYEKRLRTETRITTGYMRSALIGALFAFAWTPCVGPVLGGILTLAFGSESGLSGAYLLAFYSLGMGIPFLAVGLAFDYLLKPLKRIYRYSSYIYIASGILLIVIGVLILTNRLSWLYA